MRYLLLLLPTLLYGVDCAHPENSAEKTLCSNPELRARDQEIGAQSAALKSKLSGENAAILADTEMPFLRERNNCSNQSEIAACLAKVLAGRQELLHRTQTEPDAIRAAIAQANYIDVGFVWKYWPRLVGRDVSVYGCLMLDDPAPRTHAMLETENQRAVPVVFKSMPEEIADFLDDQKPCAHWRVQVRRQADAFVLFADEVLGRPLP